jgi:hypothetical protein
VAGEAWAVIVNQTNILRKIIASIRDTEDQASQFLMQNTQNGVFKTELMEYVGNRRVVTDVNTVGLISQNLDESGNPDGRTFTWSGIRRRTGRLTTAK